MATDARMQIHVNADVKGSALPADLVTGATPHDAWFRAKVQEALDDPQPAIPHEEVEAFFAKRRAATMTRTDTGSSCEESKSGKKP